MSFFGNLFKPRDMLSGKDGKPIAFDFLILNSQCSRLLSDFIHQHNSTVVELIIVWRDEGQKDYEIKNIPNMNNKETAGILMGAAHEVVDNGH